jgi:bifunctional UDP-N-acetylglucosamine pyrophosphorylase/glucosamine-1-phosphate N-acetyltransferase
VKPIVVILAAGLGTRMKSGLVKVLHPLAGQPLVRHVLRAVAEVGPEKVILVLGHQADAVKNATLDFSVETVLQAEQLGTGHAVQQASKAIAAAGNGPVLVLCADTPLLCSSTLKAIAEQHAKSRAVVTLLTAKMENPFGYGRVVRTKAGVQRVVEEKDANAAQKKIKEINAGIYCFDKAFLLASLSALGNNNAQGEYYLPDVIALAKKKKRIVSALLCSDANEIMGVNSRADLSKAEAVLRERVNRRWMLEGVTMLDPATTCIGVDVQLGRDVILYPNVRLEGKTRISDGCTLYPGSRIIDSTLDAQVVIKDYCVIEESTIGAGAVVGPFAHLRPKSVLGEKVKIGNFVETKKTTFGKGSKASHLSYIGDATVGKDVNIGAGVITCNYDGYDKYQTIIEDNVFVGSDAQLVAPVRIGHDAIIAAGTTVTQSVPADALAISRVAQIHREGYGTKRKLAKQKKTT